MITLKDQESEMKINEDKINYLTVLCIMNSKLNIINSRLIDVLELTENERNKYKKEISDLKTEKKKLTNIIKDYMGEKI